GFKFCNELATDPSYKAIPKIMVSGRSTREDKVFGLNCGADDYITKPFDSAELKARAEARLRNTVRDGDVFTFSCFEFQRDLSRCVINDDGGKMDLQLT